MTRSRPEPSRLHTPSFWLPLLFRLAVTTGPIALAGQEARVRVDTLTTFSLLPTAVIVRRDSTPPCYDCGSVFTAAVKYQGTDLQLDSLQDVPRLWALLPRIVDHAGPLALTNRLMTIIEATQLLGRHPSLVMGRQQLNLIARDMTKHDPVRPPQESVGGGVRATLFFVSTVDGLYRLNARLQPNNHLTISAKLIRCYLCP